MSRRKPPSGVMGNTISPTALMQQHGGAIAYAISPDHHDNQMDVKVLKYGRASLALVAKIDEVKLFVKYYDPQNADAVAS